MSNAYERLFEPTRVGGERNDRHLEKAAYLRLAQAAAQRTARENGARRAAVSFPDGREIAPVRVTVAVNDPAVVEVGRRREVAVRARADAELVPPGGGAYSGQVGGGAYHGPLAYR